MDAITTSGWSEIISAAATSPEGIIALVILAVGTLATRLFPPNDKAFIRLSVFLISVLAFVGVAMASLYNVRPAKLTENESIPKMAGVAASPSTKPESVVTQPSVVETLPLPPLAPTQTNRMDCGQNWTGWIEVGGAVGSPCNKGCYRGEELGQKYRLVGFPPRPQTQHKFQCWHD